MAMTATLAQVGTAQMGQPTTYLLTVLNSSGTAVNVNGIQPTVTTPQGSPATCANVCGPYAPTGLGVAAVGGSQFNVQVPATGSVIFPFTVQFFGPAIGGSLCQPASQFIVSANVLTSDNSVFTPPPLEVALNMPQLGTPGSPPNPVPVVGQLNFSAPLQSNLLL